MSTPLPTTPSGVLLFAADHLDALPYDRVTVTDLIIGLRMATSDYEVRKVAADAVTAHLRGEGIDGQWALCHGVPIGRDKAAAQLRAAAGRAGLVTVNG